MGKKRRTLTEAEWAKVFAARCKGKQGLALSDDERALVDLGYATDPERYAAMEPDVFNATVPFGSNVRWK